jgi:hypothetical protein
MLVYGVQWVVLEAQGRAGAESIVGIGIGLDVVHSTRCSDLGKCTQAAL